MSPIVVYVEAAPSSGLSFAGIISALSFAVALFAAYTAYDARRFTKRQHASNVKLGQFTPHSTTLTQLVAQISSIAADLARSAEATVPIETLDENFSDKFYETTETIIALCGALKEIDEAKIFGENWQIITKHQAQIEADFDCVLNSQRNEADRRSAAGRMATTLSDIAQLVRNRSIKFIKNMTEAK